MNEPDLLAMRELMTALEREGLQGPVIIDVEHTKMMRVHLLLLKGLLEERGMRGLFLSVDRPHQYMEHLARIHGINIGGLSFVDVICRYSSDTKVGGKVGLLAGPFNINNLPGAINIWARHAPGGSIDPEKGGFVLIDNPAALFPYNSSARVEFFLCHLHEAFGDGRRGLVPLLIDRERNRAIYDAVRPSCTSEVSKMDLRGAVHPPVSHGIKVGNCAGGPSYGIR